MNYGLPYKGSKNKLAERILDLMPKAGTLYDLFAGGMAVTHAALMGNKYKRVIERVFCPRGNNRASVQKKLF